MRFQFVQAYNGLSPIARRIKEEGHRVTFEREQTDSDMTIFESPLKDSRKGFPGMGCSDFVSALTYKEDYTQALLEGADIKRCVRTKEAVMFGIGCWFNGSDFVYPVIGIYEDRRLMEGGIGPSVESMGSVVRIFNEVPKVFKDTMWKLKKTLRMANFKGFLKFNCEADEDSIAVLSCYPHINYDSIYALLENTQEEIGRSLYDVWIGNKKEMRYSKYPYAISVRLTLPPFPYQKYVHRDIRAHLDGYCEGNAKHLWLQDVEWEDEDVWITGAIVGAVTARGNDIKECRRRAYRTISNLSAMDLQYRRDIGIAAQSVLPNLV